MEVGPLNSLTLKVVLSFVKKKIYMIYTIWIKRKMEGMNVVFMAHTIFLCLVDMREEKVG